MSKIDTSDERYIYCDSCKTTKKVPTRPPAYMSEQRWCEPCHAEHQREMQRKKIEDLERRP